MQPTQSAIPNYSERQVMLGLSYLAYCGDQITTPQPEAEISKLINNAIPQIPPVTQWQVVWGPISYTTPGSLYQDNLMFVARSQANKSQFAVAIRGTNFVSDLDWLMEDFDILQMMPWPPGSSFESPAGKMISESTSIDLQILLAMQSTMYDGSSSRLALSLLGFLNTQTSKSAINLCVTGHSLGGCLAGTLALYLKENTSAWDLSHQSIVSCITFAAPTAGNAEFASYSDSMFTGQTYPPSWDTNLGTTFDAVRCSFDIAPMGWIAANIANTDINSGNIQSPMFSIYAQTNNSSAPQVDFNEMKFPYDDVWSDVILPDVLPGIATQAAEKNYAQTVSAAAQLTGTFNALYQAYDDTLENTFRVFVQQATYQHSQSYPVLLGMPELNNPAIIVESPQTGTNIRRSTPQLAFLLQVISRIIQKTK